ncbi:hypothetical protein BOTBODRAFT_111572 [Botryobasidium botryosum FD-172 SS1]|uniref:Spc7 kinetochore protein domain-containing protein n=1 Tax=Botryobasidium botryosum (strain FD-172 SS1) TaxID=930990 RepID=A0A067MF32_BOTB1|nr:hypothetical protein BOTBODRAFT_111572 [Botryobasidium botryosum FD-172 SS1]
MVYFYCPDEAKLPIVDYVAAMAIFSPQLESYTWGCQELEKHIVDVQSNMEAYEEAVMDTSPPIFQDYLTSDDDNRERLEQLLKIIKTHSRLSTKADWYKWRHQIITDLQTSADEHLKKLENDNAILTELEESVAAVLPAAREEYALLEAELAKELESVAKLKECDQEVLAGLMVEITDQNAAIEGYKSDIAEANARLSRAQAKLEEVEAERTSTLDAISAARAHCDAHKGVTRNEVFRLKGQFEALADMHKWQILRIIPEKVELQYDTYLKVTVGCDQLEPTPGAVDVAYLDGPPKCDQKPLSLFGQLRIDSAYDSLKAVSASSFTLHNVVRALGDRWTSISLLHVELNLLKIRFPLELSTIDGGLGLSVQAMVLLRAVNTKVFVTFKFTRDVISSWPSRLSVVEYDVKRIYGTVEVGPALQVIKDRFSEATLSKNHGILMDACSNIRHAYTP